MAYDKKLSKQDRRAITSARRVTKATGFRESEKFLNAVSGGHVSVSKTVKTKTLTNA